MHLARKTEAYYPASGFAYLGCHLAQRLLARPPPVFGSLLGPAGVRAQERIPGRSLGDDAPGLVHRDGPGTARAHIQTQKHAHV